MITTCTTCGQCYEAGSEEQANEPTRFCPACKPKPVPYTPGPWHVRPPTAQNPSRAVVAALSGYVTIYDAPLTQETAANARLIAAAPDLLAALRDMLPLALESLKERAKLIDSGDGVGVASEGDDDDGLPAGWELRDRLYAARAAIAKAGGAA